MSLALNFIWFVLGGWLLGLAWWLSAILLAITIVGLPWAQAAWRIGSFAFFPFGREVIWKSELEGGEDIATGAWRFFLNALWFLLGGWYLALGHVVVAALFAITIVGIPFAIQHLKLAGISLAPVGREIVPKALASEIHRVNVQAQLTNIRR